MIPTSFLMGQEESEKAGKKPSREPICQLIGLEIVFVLGADWSTNIDCFVILSTCYSQTSTGMFPRRTQELPKGNYEQEGMRL